jgi:hypothetical protein
LVSIQDDGAGTTDTLVLSGASSIVTVEPLNDAPEGSVTIVGSATQGQVLQLVSSLTDRDGLGTLSYQWQRGGVDIVSATTNTYAPTQQDVGERLSVRVSYTDAQGTPEHVDSDATGPVDNVNDAPAGNVLIAGDPTQGQTLTAVANLTDADGLGTLSYQWYRDGQAIPGADLATRTLTQADVGHALTVSAQYVDGFGQTEQVLSASASAPIVNINDAPQVNLTPTLPSAPANSPYTVTLPNDFFADPDGADGVTLSAGNLPSWLSFDPTTGTLSGTPSLSDLGKTYVISVTATDAHGATATTTIEIAVAAPLPVTSGLTGYGPGAENSASTNGATQVPAVDLSPPATNAAPQDAPASTSASSTRQTPSAASAVQENKALEIVSSAARRVSSNGATAGSTASGPDGGSGGGAGFLPGTFNSGKADWSYDNWGSLVPSILLGTSTPGDVNHMELKLVPGLSAAPMHAQPMDQAASSAGSSTMEKVIKTLPKGVETGGLILSLGSVWWAARGAGLITGLLAATPVWRQIDPLPVMLNREEEEEDAADSSNDPHDRAEKLFDEKRDHVEVIS